MTLSEQCSTKFQSITFSNSARLCRVHTCLFDNQVPNEKLL